MHYLGGKNRIKKQISEIINNEISRRKIKNSKTHSKNNQQLCVGGGFVSLFCGSCVIESLVNAESKILNDKHKYLIEMYNGLQNGYELPDNLTNDEYYDIKKIKTEIKH